MDVHEFAYSLITASQSKFNRQIAGHGVGVGELTMKWNHGPTKEMHDLNLGAQDVRTPTEVVLLQLECTHVQSQKCHHSKMDIQIMYRTWWQSRFEKKKNEDSLLHITIPKINVYGTQ